jgi:hypothetical protein
MRCCLYEETSYDASAFFFFFSSFFALKKKIVHGFLGLHTHAFPPSTPPLSIPPFLVMNNRCRFLLTSPINLKSRHSYTNFIPLLRLEPHKKKLPAMPPFISCINFIFDFQNYLWAGFIGVAVEELSSSRSPSLREVVRYQSMMEEGGWGLGICNAFKVTMPASFVFVTRRKILGSRWWQLFVFVIQLGLRRPTTVSIIRTSWSVRIRLRAVRSGWFSASLIHLRRREKIHLWQREKGNHEQQDPDELAPQCYMCTHDGCSEGRYQVDTASSFN